MYKPIRSSIKILAAATILISTPAAAQSVQDDQWPVSFQSEGWQVQLFAPQPESILGDRFKARAAVALQGVGDEQPVFGAIWADGVMEVDRTSRLGQLTAFIVTDARFPDLDQQELEQLKAMLTREIPGHTRPIPIDWLVAALESEQQYGGTYRNDPPEIIYSERPAVLVLIDGEPQYEKIGARGDERGDAVYASTGRDIERVVNTPFLLTRWKGGDHYLYGSGNWFRATDIKGPWQPTKEVPAELGQLADKMDTASSRKPATSGSGPVIPEVVVRNAPAELIDFNGPPQLLPLQRTNLLYASNTDDDVFMDIASQEYYLLASGRWFATRSLKNGPWRYVEADKLPTDFQGIPEGSAKDGVLAHVPGTNAAREAVRDASIPQTARVDRKGATVSVTYDGDPQFQQIEGTTVHQAMNASTTVLRIDGRYHVCDNAVWYNGPTPDGPWSVSTEVPAAVNTIPPSSDAYNVRYVYIYDHDPNWVYMGYTPGYMGCYVQNNVVVFGTGYYYRPWSNYWYPRPWTWGFNMYYDPWIGWNFGWSWGWNWFYPSWYYGGGYYGGGYGNHWHGCGWWGPWGWNPQVIESHHHYYGHRPTMNGGRTNADGNGWGRVAAPSLYAQRPNPAVQPTTLNRERTPTSMTTAQTTVAMATYIAGT